MAALGSIAQLGIIAKMGTGFNLPSTLRKITIGITEFVPGGKSTTEGNPSNPSLRLDTFGFWRFRWTVSAGTRTIQIDVKQAENQSPRPRVTILANAGIGVASNVTGSAASGTGWTTIGPLTITPSGRGAVWVRLENLYVGQYSPCYWDHIVTT